LLPEMHPGCQVGQEENGYHGYRKDKVFWSCQFLPFYARWFLLPLSIYLIRFQCLLDELNIGTGEAECPVDGWECNVDGDSFEIHYKGSLTRKQLENRCGVMSNHNRYGVRGVLRCPPPSCPEFAEFTFERSGAWNFECEKPDQQF
jgi:hypothetical protein